MARLQRLGLVDVETDARVSDPEDKSSDFVDIDETYNLTPTCDALLELLEHVGSDANAQGTLFDLLGFALDHHGAANVAWTDDGTAYPNNVQTRIEYALEVVPGS